MNKDRVGKKNDVDKDRAGRETGGKKKVRRGKPIRNKFKNFKIYYVNIRGIKSKMTELKRIIREERPHVICLTETLLRPSEWVEIDKNYKFYHNSEHEDKWGIAIGVDRRLDNITIEIERKSLDYESLWLLMSNDRVKVRIGNIYAPQESRTKIEVFEGMYEHIRGHKMEADKKGEKVIVMGDFNCKIGKQPSKSGKVLKQVVKESGMVVLNQHEKCEGKWTRIQGEQKSTIDYVLVDKVDGKYLKKMVIDEDKINTPYHVTREGKVYTDHCAIEVVMDWYTAYKEEEVEYVTNYKKCVEEFQKSTDGDKLTRIASQEKGITEKYSEWQEGVDAIMKRCFEGSRKKKRKTVGKNEEVLIRNRKEVKRNLKEEKGKEERQRLLKIQVDLIDEYLREEEARRESEEVDRELEKLKKEGLNTNAFWEFKKQMERKKKEELPSAMLDKAGGLKTEKQEILDVYEDFYRELFIQEEEDTELAKQVKEIREIVFESINMMAEIDSNRRKVVTKERVRESINSLKNKNTRDRQGWSNTLLKNSGQDVIDSLTMLLEEIDEKIIIPIEWIEMLIISLYKNKGKREDMENRRGLFITSTISKVYEKVLQINNIKKYEEKVSKYQCGGRKEKMPADHVMTLNAVIDYNKFLGRETYILFADAYKCFDKLNLKECVKEYYKIVGATEAMKIYKMNEVGKAVVRTPLGETGMIEVNEVVRQGTVTGPKLCSNDTDQVNKVGHQHITTIGPNIIVKTMAYVDDLQNPSSSVSGLKAAGENLRTMEQTKGYTFNTERNKTAILIANKKKNKDYEEVKVSMKRGVVEQTEEYKYVGEWYNEKYNHNTSLRKKEEKVGHYAQQVRVYGNEYRLKRYTLNARLKLYRTTVVPSLFYSVETWSHMTNGDVERLESMQYEILRKIMEQRSSVPYFGLLAETGVWPVEQLIELRKILLMNNIMNTKGERLIKEILEDQIRETWKGCWVEGLKKVLEKYEIRLEEVIKLKKDKLKEKVVQRIEGYLDKKLKGDTSTKLRFIEKFEKKEYITEMDYEDSILMLKVRLNMIEVKCNYKNKYRENRVCDICRVGEDTTEHMIFECDKIHPLKGMLDGVDIKKGNKRIPGEVRYIMNKRKEKGYELKIK